MSPWASIQITAKSSPKYLLAPASDPKAKEWSPPTINGKVSFSNASKTLDESLENILLTDSNVHRLISTLNEQSINLNKSNEIDRFI